MLEISASARDKIVELMQGRDGGDLVVRVLVTGRLPGGGYQTEFQFVGRDERQDTDAVQDAGGFLLYFDPSCAASLRGAKVNYDASKYNAGFNIDYPQTPTVLPPGVEQRRDWTELTAIAVQKVVDEHINPGVSVHDGWVLLLDVKDEAAYIEMGGGCQGCGMAFVTLKQGIEQMIMQNVPQIKQVIDITEHADGTNPYYSPAAGGDSPFG
ncbi:MAG: iron-sulfur cluster assembly accessory protein [Chloroflexi bacterium]|nr:iron-sulfur cluster assembly accessory protein [Chloroflexota bacterium]